MNTPAATTLSRLNAANIAMSVSVVIIAVVITPIEGAGLVLAMTD